MVKKILWSYLWLKEEEKNMKKPYYVFLVITTFFCKIYCALCMPFFVIFVVKNIASIILLLIFIQHKITCQQCTFSDQSDQSIRPPHQSQLLDISYYNVFLIWYDMYVWRLSEVPKPMAHVFIIFLVFALTIRLLVQLWK